MSEVFFDPAVGGDGSTVSDDGNPATGLANSGHRTRFVPALAQVVAVAAHVVDTANLITAAVDTVAEGVAAADASVLAAAEQVALANNQRVLATAQGGVAVAAALEAGGYKDDAQGAAAAALAALETLNLPAIAPGDGGLSLRTKIDGSGWELSDPFPDQAGQTGKALFATGAGVAWQWAEELKRVTRTSNTILGAADRGKLIDITSGTFTQTLTAAATLGDGWYCYLRNAGSGDVTLDPNGTEQIDGLTSYVMYPGECRIVQCTGAAFFSVVMSGFYRVFTTSGTFVVPPGYSTIEGLLWGGGGGGASSSGGGSPSGGGGGGACVPLCFPKGTSGTLSVVIGAGGASGSSGGVSSCGSRYAYPGGGGSNSSGGGGGGCLGAGVGAGPGFPSTSSMQSDFGGGSTQSTNMQPNSGYGGGAGGSNNQNAGSSLFGGGGGGYSINGSGGSSIYGGAGGSGTTASGVAGTAPGGGGGGGGYSSAGLGGAGARGECRLWGRV